MKPLIVVLVILVVLMAVGMGLGARPKGNSVSTAFKGWPEQIGKLLVKKQPLSAQDVQAAFPTECLSELRQGTLVLGQGGSCQYAVRESRTNVRQTTLRLEQGASVNVHLELYGENRLNSDIKLEPGEKKSSKEIQFFRDGGVLTVTCLQAVPGGQCRILAR